MDNHCVPNLTGGPMVAQAIQPFCRKPDYEALIDAMRAELA